MRDNDGEIIYIIGSLRDQTNPKERNMKVIEIAKKLRKLGYRVFDDWISPGPRADDYWKEYEESRGRTYKEALKGWAGKHVFEFDKHHLDAAAIALLVLPAGKSAHLELGYMIGKGKVGCILMDKPDRWDVMYQFANSIFFIEEEMFDYFKNRKKLRK